MEVMDQTIAIYAASKGHFDTVPTKKIRQAEADLLSFLKSRNTELMNDLHAKKEISAENEVKLIEAIKNFLSTNKY
jgi:F0F1-type ATP synthase alpha subunit